MSRRIISEPHQASEPRERDLARSDRGRREMWREVLASQPGRYVLAEMIEILTRGEISAGNSEIHKNAARADFARWIETQIGQIDRGALIAIHLALIRTRFSEPHDDNKKETEEEET